MQYLPQIVSALNAVSESYMNIPVADKRKNIVRERVFCYEFYHQMRLQDFEERGQFHGEITKSGSTDFKSENPDFIFHTAGTNEGNKFVCEVKGAFRKEGLTKDLTTIKNFIERNSYQFGILIIYGKTRDSFIKLRRDVLINFAFEPCADRIWLITLPCAGNCEYPVRLSNLDLQHKIRTLSSKRQSR